MASGAARAVPRAGPARAGRHGCVSSLSDHRTFERNELGQPVPRAVREPRRARPAHGGGAGPGRASQPAQLAARPDGCVALFGRLLRPVDRGPRTRGAGADDAHPGRCTPPHAARAACRAAARPQVLALGHAPGARPAPVRHRRRRGASRGPAARAAPAHPRRRRSDRHQPAGAARGTCAADVPRGRFRPVRRPVGRRPPRAPAPPPAGSGCRPRPRFPPPGRRSAASPRPAGPPPCPPGRCRCSAPAWRG